MSHELQLACWFDSIRSKNLNAIVTLYRTFDLDINDNSSYEEYFATPMLIAVETDNEHVIRLIGDLGGDVNMADYYGVTPLYKAVEDSRLTSVKTLLELGADLYVEVYGRTYRTHTPLDCMKDNGTYPLAIRYTREHHTRLRKLRVYAKVVGRMMMRYHQSVEHVWRPGGKGYLMAKHRFENQQKNHVIARQQTETLSS